MVLHVDETLQRAKLSSESPAPSSAARIRVDTGVICMSSNHLLHLRSTFKLVALSQTWTVLYLSQDDGSTVTDVEQEEKKGPLCRRANYLSRSVEDIRTPLPGFATVSLPCPKQSLIKQIVVLEHSLDDMRRVVRCKLGLPDDLDVQLTQIRGNSSIVLEDGNDVHHPLRWP